MKKTLIFLIPIGLAIAVFAAYKFVYKEHRDIGSEEAAFALTVQDLQKAFIENDSLANARYADETVEVSGKITSVDEASRTIVLDEKLSAVLAAKDTTGYGLNKMVKIKGRFVGYDDLLEELRMDQVSIIN